MKKQLFHCITVMILILILSGCSKPLDNANMANPASVFCEDNAGKLEIRSDSSGAQTGYCIFDDGSECEEWAYFRGECQPGDSLAPAEGKEPPAVGIANPASEFCVANGGESKIITFSDGSQIGRCVFPDASSCEEWAFFDSKCEQGLDFGGIQLAADDCRLYHNQALSYEVHFPIDAIITTDSAFNSRVIIKGALIDGEPWPYIFINHPQNRADYQPPVDSNLLDWLIQNDLIEGERAEDRIIGNEPAIHTRPPSEERAYPSDSFWFMHNGQLFNIYILHTVEGQGWELYNHILDSFQFTGDNIYP